MGFFQRLFGKTAAEELSNPSPPDRESAGAAASEWEPVPGFIPADPSDYQLVSVIATAIAAGDNQDRKFVVRRILQRNPEALRVSLIAASIAAGEAADCQLAVKNIYQKKDL